MSSAPTKSTSSRFLVCEKTGKWAVALRRELAADARWLVGTRALSQLIEALAQHPASVAAIEHTPAGPAELAGALTQLHDEFPDATFVIFAKQVSPDTQWLLREAGAVHVADSPRRLAPVARIWQRHRRQHPPAESGVREILWEQLPWQTAVSAPLATSD
jgi:hypothetical protein